MNNSKTGIVIKYLFKYYRSSFIWYLGILIIAVSALRLFVAASTTGDGESLGEIAFLSYSAYINSTMIFMLVIGIFTVSTVMATLVAEGVTRRECSLGTFVFVFAASCAFAMFFFLAIWFIAGEHVEILRILIDVMMLMLSYMAGWFFNVMYYSRGVIACLISIAAVLAIMGFAGSFWFGFKVESYSEVVDGGMEVSSSAGGLLSDYLATLGVAFAAAVLFGLILYQLSIRVNVKTK